MNTSMLPSWNMDFLSEVPRFEVDPERCVESVKAVFFEGALWKGKPTRVFAYCGIPKTKADEQVPAMVLVHGGGGSAYHHWVKLWVSRGYAAIAMDTCGCISGSGHENHTRHADGGPAGWGGFDQIDEPAEDQWAFHAVSAVVRAHSLLRSFPQVDPARIGITGISWGGYLTCISAGIDQRFAFAAPVYGCGFLTEIPNWRVEFDKMKPGNSERWGRLWDPLNYLSQVKYPMLWVNGTNDFAFPMDSWQKSYRLLEGSRTLSLKVRMEHNHRAGENPSEIHAFADSILRSAGPLAQITHCSLEGRNLRASFESCEPITKAEFCYTTETGVWVNRQWQTLLAELDAVGGNVSADLPAATTVCYLNIIDSKDRVMSSEHVEIY
ncbi:MAG: alpha/beta hydrolase family protein [Verrucomicrobiota bacterium]